jgi:hypothetical protein
MTLEKMPTSIRRKLSRRFDAEAVIDLLNLAFSKLPRRVIEEHCPPWTIEPLPLTFGRSIRLQWRCLQRKVINGQSIIYSSRRPTVEIQGGHWLTGWTNHAVDRLFDRTVEGRHSYVAIYDVVTTIDAGCTYTESDLRSGRGDRCMDVWFEPAEDSIAEVILRAIFDGLRPTGYHVLGCTCPIDFQGKFALCVTALAPSMLVYSSKDPRSQLLNWSTIYDTLAPDPEQWVRQIRELHEQKPLVRKLGVTRFVKTTIVS